MKKYLGQHIRHRQLTPELRNRTIEVFLRSFDPSQSAMLESEIEAMKAQLLAEFDKIENGDCSAISTVHQKFAQRQKEIATFVKDFVSAEDYAIDMEVELVIDAKKRGYPKTVAERDHLHAQARPLPDVELHQQCDHDGRSKGTAGEPV